MFNLFGKKTKEFNVDLSQLGADMHSHLIPGIDDGAKSLEDSINLITELKKLGYTKLITTPHIMSDYYKNTPEIINNGLQKVRQELQRLSIDMEIEAAAEYYYDEYFLEVLKSGNLLTINKEYILFELSYLTKPSGIREVIFDIQTRGYKPLLAHPERYPYLSLKEYMVYKEAGCFFQMNILSFCGHYGKSAEKSAELLMEYNLVDFLGTDLHHMQHIRIMKNEALKQEKLNELLSFGNLKNRELL